MTETKHPGEKLTVAPTKATLSLKRPGVEQGVVKQSFSHGRTKAVVVEKVKSRRGEPRSEPVLRPGNGCCEAGLFLSGYVPIPFQFFELLAASGGSYERS